MKEQKAKEYLEHMLWCMGDEPPENLTDERDIKEWEDEHRRIKETFIVAIRTLEKQIPNSPIYRSCRCEDGVEETWICPNCTIDLDVNGGLFRRHVDQIRYCELCGQRIDWNEKWNF